MLQNVTFTLLCSFLAFQNGTLPVDNVFKFIDKNKCSIYFIIDI